MGVVMLSQYLNKLTVTSVFSSGDAVTYRKASGLPYNHTNSFISPNLE